MNQILTVWVQLIQEICAGPKASIQLCWFKCHSILARERVHIFLMKPKNELHRQFRASKMVRSLLREKTCIPMRREGFQLGSHKVAGSRGFYRPSSGCGSTYMLIRCRKGAMLIDWFSTRLAQIGGPCSPYLHQGHPAVSSQSVLPFLPSPIHTHTLLGQGRASRK
jgi:hypothetical protein